MLLKPDPTFYATANDAMKAPPETFAYVALLSATGNGKPDAIAVIDTDSTSKAYGSQVRSVELPNTGDELHHFGWNACSSASAAKKLWLSPPCPLLEKSLFRFGMIWLNFSRNGIRSRHRTGNPRPA